MALQIGKQVLAIYSWLLIGGLLFFLWRVAGFYERASGHRVGHHLLVVPTVLLAGGAFWYLVHDNDFVGRPLGDILLFAGGVLLFLFGNRLEKLMTGE